MGKKRKHSESTDDDLGAKRVKNESLMEDSMVDNVNNISINGESKFKVFLIKKPIGVSLEDLEALKWSNDEEILEKSKIKTETGIFRALVASKAKKQRMVHIPAIREREEVDSKAIRAQNFVDGAITILPVEAKSKTLGGSIYEEGEEPAMDAETHPALKKIKKTAILKLDDRKQRNKAYGTKTDADGKPRKLPTIFMEKAN